MNRNLLLSPDGGEGGAPAPAQSDENTGGKLFERLVGHLDKRDERLLETLRAEVTTSIDERLKTRNAAAEHEAVAQALRAAAEASGALDFETIDRLIARDAITVDEGGTVSGVREAVERLKSSKPFLFGSTRPSGGTARTPRPVAARAKSAKDLTPAEWHAEKKRLGVRS